MVVVLRLGSGLSLSTATVFGVMLFKSIANGGEMSTYYGFAIEIMIETTEASKVMIAKVMVVPFCLLCALDSLSNSSVLQTKFFVSVSKLDW